MLSNTKRPALYGGLLLVCLLAMLSTIYLNKAKATSTDLLSTASPRVKAISTTTMMPHSLNGNIDCLQESPSACVVATRFGFMDQNSNVKFTNSRDYHRLNDYSSGRSRIIPIPNSESVISYDPNTVYGDYLYFTSGLYSNIRKYIPLGQNVIEYQITKPPEGKLTDKSGQLLAGDYDSISFSVNGEWMVVSVPNIAVLRVNLKTYEAIPFAAGFDYSLGLSPGLQTAISNDGRYAVIASEQFSRFEIYDMNSCGAVPDKIIGPVQCRVRSLRNLLASQIASFYKASNLRFIDDQHLSFYVMNGGKAVKYVLGADDSTSYGQEYLALGDSYISGEGAYNYLSGTDTADNQCHVSSVSYPLLIGYRLNFNSYHSVSCSGAITTDIYDSSPEYSGQAKPHFSRKDLDKAGKSELYLNEFSQGYIYQNNFVATYQPKLIVISVGGNDIGFSKRLQSCLGAGTCFSTYEDRLEFVREVNSKFNVFVNTYEMIKGAGLPDAKIFVVGYPQIALAGGDCALNVHLNQNELVFATEAIDYLDSVIKLAAEKAGIYYIDTQNALVGHRLCEDKNSSIAINGITAGNDFPDFIGGPIGRESFHPNALGHKLLQDKILEQTDNLKNAMPATNPLIKPPAEEGLAILNAPKSGRTTSEIMYSPSFTEDVVIKNQSFEMSVNGEAISLPPQTDFIAEIHSDPSYIGTVRSDNSGNINASLVLPSTIKQGFHSLHLLGLNRDGLPVDIYTYIYVAENQADYDGDGLPNTQDKCWFIEQSNIDGDGDGVDDACDGYIGSDSRESKNYDQASSANGVVKLDFKSRNDASDSKSNTTAIVLAASKNLADLSEKGVPASESLFSISGHARQLFELSAFGIIMGFVWKFSG